MPVHVRGKTTSLSLTNASMARTHLVEIVFFINLSLDLAIHCESQEIGVLLASRGGGIQLRLS